MGSLLAPITGFFGDLNYVYAVELLVILSIVIFVLYVFYSLGLLKKPN